MEKTHVIVQCQNSQLTCSSHLVRGSPGFPLLEVFQARPTGSKPWTCWTDYVSCAACRCFIIPQEDLGNVAGEWIILNCCHRDLIPDKWSQTRGGLSLALDCTLHSLHVDFLFFLLVQRVSSFPFSPMEVPCSGPILSSKLKSASTDTFIIVFIYVYV